MIFVFFSFFFSLFLYLYSHNLFFLFFISFLFFLFLNTFILFYLFFGFILFLLRFFFYCYKLCYRRYFRCFIRGHRVLFTFLSSLPSFSMFLFKLFTLTDSILFGTSARSTYDPAYGPVKTGAVISFNSDIIYVSPFDAPEADGTQHRISSVFCRFLFEALVGCFSFRRFRGTHQGSFIADFRNPYLLNSSESISELICFDPHSHFSFFPYFFPLYRNPLFLVYIDIVLSKFIVDFDPVYGCYARYCCPMLDSLDVIPDGRSSYYRLTNPLSDYIRYDLSFIFERPIVLKRIESVDLSKYFQEDQLYLFLVYLRRIRRYIVNPCSYSLEHCFKNPIYNEKLEPFTFNLARFLSKGDYLGLFYKTSHLYSHQLFTINLPFKRAFSRTISFIIATTCFVTGFSKFVSTLILSNLIIFIVVCFIVLFSFIFFLIYIRASFLSGLELVLLLIRRFFIVFFILFVFPFMSGFVGLVFFLCFLFYTYLYLPYRMYFSYNFMFTEEYYTSRYDSMYRKHRLRFIQYQLDSHKGLDLERYKVCTILS